MPSYDNRRMRLWVALLTLLATLSSATAEETFTTKEEAEAWFTKNLTVGMQCGDLLSLHSENIEVAAVGEDMTSSDTGPDFVTWWTDVTLQYGADKMCPLQKRAHCNGAGKVATIEPMARECP